MADLALVGEYYTNAFALLHERYQKDFQEAGSAEPYKLVRQFMLESLPTDTPLNGKTAWEPLRTVLERLENEMSKTLCQRSMFFWFHLYRRIAVVPLTEGKNREWTLNIVRHTVDLAIVKHADITHSDEISPAGQLNPDVILGGWMRRGVKHYAKLRPERTYKEFSANIKKLNAFVIRKFAPDDLASVYRLEGIAFQYWRVSALARSIGKGGEIIIDRNGDWHYLEDKDFSWLIASIDERMSRYESRGSLLGTWVDPSPQAMPIDNLHKYLVYPTYNVHRLPLGDFTKPFGFELSPHSILNFQPHVIDIHGYAHAHGFLSKALREKLGFGIEAICAVIWALCSVAMMPNQALFTADTAEKLHLLLLNTLNILKRGYFLHPATDQRLAEVVAERLQDFKYPDKIDGDEIKAALRHITLTAENRARISLWSKGPWHLVFPKVDNKMIDTHGIPHLLHGLFAFLSHNASERGLLFEDAFRKALKHRGFDITSGKLKVGGKLKRELDAGVHLGNTLYVCECISIEVPLDYDLGKPSVFDKRRELLQEKLDQAFSLTKFLRETPIGSSYDYGDIEHFVPCVVSPFKEWIWERKSDELWIEEDVVPRILSADEAIDMLERKRPIKKAKA